ncbi:hypothetical protein SDC9_77844 [bioreactor metagenome]|uniref:Uncharacterized protein n=1 Tax=bioreactor metagenome TaxID=1076179 RepID=A0A644YSI6_9ZZZZ
MLRHQVRHQVGFQPVQTHIRQGWRDDSALRRSFIGWRQAALVDHSGFQPLAQDRPVHGNMTHQPFMVDVIKATFDIRLQHPRGRGLLGCTDEYLRHGICRRTMPPKAVAVWIARGFCNRLHTEEVQCLHGPVKHGRNAQWAFFPVRLGDVDPPQWHGPVSPQLLQSTNRRPFQGRRIPKLAVDPCRLLALVFSDSPNRQCSGRKRVVQRPLQGFHPAPILVQRSLRYALLRRSHELLDPMPIDGMPVLRFV